MAQEFSGVKVDHLETIEAFCKPPWEPGANTYIEDDAKSTAHALRQEPRQSKWFTAVSAKHQRIGIGVFNTYYEKSRTVAICQEANTYYGELAAMYDIVELITQISIDCPWAHGDTLVIYSSNQAAIKSLAKPAHQSGQHMIVRLLLKLRHNRCAHGPEIEFRWIPAQVAIPEKRKARRLALRATKPQDTLEIPFVHLKSAILRRAKEDLYKQEPRVLRSIGRFTWELDQALPGKHTKLIYNNLNRRDASLLAQVRTAKCRLNDYLAKIGAVETNMCVQCGKPETVKHYLLQCHQ